MITKKLTTNKKKNKNEGRPFFCEEAYTATGLYKI
jgi:hypothetical protein